MKKLFALAAMSTLLFSTFAVNAWDNHNANAKPEFAEPLLQKDLNFTADLVDGHVMMNWDHIAMPNGEQFLWYKLMRGAANAVYPDQGAIHVGVKEYETTAKDWKPGESQHYRVCLITKKSNGQKWRYCSEAVYITSNGTSATKTYPEKKEYTTTSKLSQKVKDKLEKIVDGFLMKIDEKYGDDEEMKTAVIKTVIEKIEDLKAKKPHMKEILAYLATLLNEAIDLDDIESIFDI